jgi:hypothetical protein
MRDNFEGVALVNEELLSLGAVVHLLCILGDKRVEKCVEAFIVPPLSTKNTTF